MYSEHIIQYIGISTDEAHRMKDSRIKWITNKHPLILDKFMSREDCLKWMERNGYPKPPRSACYFCPFHSNEEWLRMKTKTPKEFERAIELEKQYLEAQTKQNALTNTAYLHPSRKPLNEVDFTDHSHNPRQLSLFGNECEGMCGV